MSKIKHFGFNPKNYKFLIIGLIINVLGFVLMIGGGSEDPNSFNADELFSTRRITIAPIVVLLGFAIEIYAIFHKKSN